MNNDDTSVKPGLFIAIEGADGSGKTSMTKYFTEKLHQLGFPVVRTRELGGTPVAEKLRDLITGADPVTRTEVVDKHTRILMVIASRIQHIKHVIKPGVIAGKIVVTDRCFDSTHVYQGVKDGLLPMLSMLEGMSEISVVGERPDYTIFLDVSPEVSMARTAEHDAKGETMNVEGGLQERIADINSYRERMAAAAVQKPGSIFVVNADGTEEEVKHSLDRFALGLSLKRPELTTIQMPAPAEEPTPA